ncbi:DNA polymerase III subunit chi [Litorimonas cladophorae]|uniref:DNA polymerase III subunit chi n=1 Tax=Litorimonas cladophorae TaxID=1220491 RepID=A0A918NEP5_9PROT|nr:DNA polymerase III subunit chi [Litorimonas cladophorae]GGX61594.1 DNA polymerase III subunit chi [Litorimonas cladophorae]
MPTDYWFYHLEASTLEGVLPGLLEKTLQKGWRALVKLPAAKLEQMDKLLWTFRDDSFLPHGREDEPQSDLQPILLTATLDSAAGFDAVFLIDGAEMRELADASRAMVMINGRSQDDIARERERWKRLKSEGASLAYYQQDDRGRWTKKA